jgi:hypothetical protein
LVPAPPLSDEERALGRKLAIASNVPWQTFWVAFSEQLPTLALISLGASETLIGAQSGLRLVLGGIQLPALRLISWYSKRSILISGHLIAQLASLPLVFFPLIAALEHDTAVGLVFAALAFTALGLDLGDLVWFPLLRAYVEPERIGRFFGAIRTSWHAAVILFLVGGHFWLARHESGFGLLFGIAWALGLVRLFMVWRLPERSERGGEGVESGHGNVIEETKAHRLVGGGVMTRRTDAAECVAGFAFQHQVGGQDRRARCSQGCGIGVPVHRRVRVEVNDSGSGRSGGHRIHVVGSMDARELLAGGERGFAFHQAAQYARGNQLILDCLEPLRALWVMAAHIVQLTVVVRDEGCGHTERLAQVVRSNDDNGFLKAEVYAKRWNKPTPARLPRH